MEKTKINNIAKQGAILASAGLFVRFIGFLYRMPLAAMIGDIGNGIYSAGYYIYMFFLMVSSAGLPSAISKMTAERISKHKYKEAHRIFIVSIAFAITTGTVCMFVLFFGANSMDKNADGTRYVLKTLAPTVLIVSIMAVFRGYFQGMKSTVPTAISQIIEQILNAISSIVMCYVFLHAAFSTHMIGGPIAMGAAGGTMGTGIGALAGLITLIYIYVNKKHKILALVKKDKQKASSYSKLLAEIIGTAFPIILGSAIFSITNMIDVFFVRDRIFASGAFTHDEVQALYGQLTGKFLVITALPLSISVSLATASIPDIAESVSLKRYDLVNEKINTAVKLTMMIAIPATVGISILANQIIVLLFASYPKGGLLLEFGATSIIFLSLAQILGGMLQGISKFYIPVIAACFGAIVKIIITFTLTSNPKINIYGAIAGTIGCYLVASVINYFALEKITNTKIDFTNIFLKPAFSALFMGLIVFNSYWVVFDLTRSNLLGILAAVLIGSSSYFIALYMIGGVTKEEIEALPMGRRITKLFF